MNYKWNVIQTHNADSYSDTDSDNLHVILSNHWCSLIVVKVSEGKNKAPEIRHFADNWGVSPT